MQEYSTRTTKYITKSVKLKSLVFLLPTIINACETMFNKHPDHLLSDEIIKFNNYRRWKSEIGDSMEKNPIYLPIGGLRKCVICENLT